MAVPVDCDVSQFDHESDCVIDSEAPLAALSVARVCEASVSVPVIRAVVSASPVAVPFPDVGTAEVPEVPVGSAAVSDKLAEESAVFVSAAVEAATLLVVPLGAPLSVTAVVAIGPKEASEVVWDGDPLVALWSAVVGTTGPKELVSTVFVAWTSVTLEALPFEDGSAVVAGRALNVDSALEVAPASVVAKEADSGGTELVAKVAVEVTGTPCVTDVGAGLTISVPVDVTATGSELPAGSAVVVTPAITEVVIGASPFNSVPLRLGLAVAHTSLSAYDPVVCIDATYH